MANETERHEHQEEGLQWPITILAEQGAVEGITINVNDDGILIHCEEPLLLKATYRMSIFPPNQQAIETLGKVISSEFYGMGEDNATFGMGVCQVQVPDEDLQFLNELVLTIPI